MNHHIKIQTKEIDGETWIKFDSEYDRIRWKYGTIILIGTLILMGIILYYMIFNILPNIEMLKTNPCLICEEQNYVCTRLFG